MSACVAPGPVARWEAQDAAGRHAHLLRASDASSVEELQRMRAALVRTQGPGVPSVLEGVGPDWFVHAAPAGQPLTRWMSRGPGPDEVLAVAATLAEILARAHAQGCAHGLLGGEDVWVGEGDAVLVLGLRVEEGPAAMAEDAWSLGALLLGALREVDALRVAGRGAQEAYAAVAERDPRLAGVLATLLAANPRARSTCAQAAPALRASVAGASGWVASPSPESGDDVTHASGVSDDDLSLRPAAAASHGGETRTQTEPVRTAAPPASVPHGSVVPVSASPEPVAPASVSPVSVSPEEASPASVTHGSGAPLPSPLFVPEPVTPTAHGPVTPAPASPKKPVRIVPATVTRGSDTRVAPAPVAPSPVAPSPAPVSVVPVEETLSPSLSDAPDAPAPRRLVPVVRTGGAPLATTTPPASPEPVVEIPTMDDPWFTESPMGVDPHASAVPPSVTPRPPSSPDPDLLAPLEPHTGGIGALLGGVSRDGAPGAKPVRDPRREALLEALAVTTFALYLGLGIAALWMRWE